jgi:hypothetical protein
MLCKSALIMRRKHAWSCTVQHARIASSSLRRRPPLTFGDVHPPYDLPSVHVHTPDQLHITTTLMWNNGKIVCCSTSKKARLR